MRGAWRWELRLHYAELQVVVGAVFAALAVALAVLFVAVASQTRSDVPFERVQRTGYWIRKRWLAFLTVLLVLVVGISAFALPYSGSAASRTIVTVTGGQFFWALAPAEVTAGTRVRFDVSSVDVNHGFGLYDPHGKLLGSVQAMPGYHNQLDLTLDEPGRYHILCLEYCGLNHHRMFGVLSVKGR